MLENLPVGRQLIRIIEGPHAGTEMVLVQTAPPAVGRLSEYLGEDAVASDGSGLPGLTAERLLRSLLDPDQLADWTAWRRFDVPTPFGPVRLGRLYHLEFRPWSGPDITLCVVPEGQDALPVQDIWVNLLLALRSDPEQFFKVANWRRPKGEWMFGPVPRSLLVRRGHPEVPGACPTNGNAVPPRQLALF